MAKFTEDELLAAASEKYGGPISTDMLEDAMQESTLEEAIEVLIVDSAYWDGSAFNFE